MFVFYLFIRLQLVMKYSKLGVLKFCAFERLLIFSVNVWKPSYCKYDFRISSTSSPLTFLPYKDRLIFIPSSLVLGKREVGMLAG